LCRTIATGGGAASPAVQQIDETFAGEIETMAITADERASATVRSSRQIGHRSNPWPERGASGATVPLQHYEKQKSCHARVTSTAFGGILSARRHIVKRQRLSLQQSRKLETIWLMYLAGRIAERRGRRCI
jgi:hypothetical protein